MVVSGSGEGEGAGEGDRLLCSEGEISVECSLPMREEGEYLSRIG